MKSVIVAGARDGACGKEQGRSGTLWGRPWLRGRIGGMVSLALLVGACGGTVEDEGAESGVASDSSGLKNGALFDGGTRWKGVLRLQIQTNGVWLTCTGVVGSRNTIVTAAHCVSGALYPWTSGNVKVSATRETSAGVHVTVLPQSWCYVKYNPAYDGQAMSDVAVIRAPTSLSNVVQSDAVPFAKDWISDQTMYALGYGFSDNGQSEDVFGRSAGFPPTYSKIYHEYRYTGLRATDPWICQGDSGGPLKKIDGVWKIFGIVSHSEGGNNSDVCKPTAYWAATFDVWPWLEAAIGYDKCLGTSSILTCW